MSSRAVVSARATVVYIIIYYNIMMHQRLRYSVSQYVWTQKEGHYWQTGHSNEGIPSAP